MYGSMEQSTAAAAPALGPEEVKFVRKLMATNGDDARSAGLSHESQESSGSTLPTLATQALSTSTLMHLLGDCAAGYTYAGQILFDSEVFSSTYPDFYPFCGEAGGCGNTCCVPSDELDGAPAAAGD